jgi:hypothetical protein
MMRRLSRVGRIALALLAFGATGPALAARREAGPNVVLILTDDKY